MKKLFILISLILLISLSYAWDLHRQAQFPTNFYTLDRVGNTIWAAGYVGGFAKSTNGGQTWSFVPNPCYDAVNSVYKDIPDLDFYDANHGVMVGEAGLVALTADGGTTWTLAVGAATIFGTNGVLACTYLPDGKIWAAGFGGIIAYSADNGVTWVAQTSGLADQIYAISMNAQGTGFCAMNNGNPDQSKIVKTVDFGATWTVQNLTITGNPTFQEVKQVGSTVLLAGSAGYVGVSNDNGATWTHHVAAGGSANAIHDICLNGQTGYAVGWNSTVLKTTDGWATFTVIPNNFGKYFEQINVLDNGNLLALGWNGAIATSTAQAADWTDLVVNSVDVYSASVVDENTWYLAGDKGSLLKTTNGGQSFTTLHIPADMSTYYAVYFKTANEGWVTGKTTGKIFHTTDGGITWSTFTVPGVTAAKSYYEFFFTSATTGYALGVPTRSVKTTDGGLTWTIMADAGLAANNNLNCAFFQSDSLGFAGSGSGQVFITTNSCASWTPIVVGNAGAYIRDIWFKDAQHGVLVNSMGEIYYTTTGGMTATDWTLGTESCLDDMNGVWSDANGVFWAAGYSSDNTTSNIGNSWALVKSTNNGATWSQETFPALTFNATRLMGVTGANGKLVAYGKNNVVLSAVNGGGTPTLATNLFFSEYVEGSSNNKAIEIFNGTGAAVDLSAYSVKLGANGAAFGTTLALTGMLANNDVYVIANAGSNAAILAVSDITSTVTYYNGDDALGLFQGTNLIDTIGQELIDPGTAWAVAGTTDAMLNHTLIRKETVISPSTDWASSAGTDLDNSQWVVQPVDYITNLGAHTFNPNGTTTPHVAMPVFTPPAGIYSAPLNVTITTSTPNATIYYTTDGSTPTTASPVYSGAIPVAVTSTLKAMATADTYLPSNVATAVYTFPVVVTNLAALRASTPDGTTIYQVSGQVVMTFKQTFRNQKYLQDASAAILVDDLAAVITTAYNVGDGITGIVGKISEFGGMLQFVPTANPGAATSTGNVITPQAITLTELTTNYEAYESELVKILNCSFTAPTGNFANGIVYPINDGTADFSFRTSFYDVNYIGDPIPTIPMHVVGLPNSRVDGNYFTSRDSLDIILPTGGVAAPTFNPPAGMYYSAFTVTLACSTAGTQIRYTTDGTTPTATSTLFTNPIPVAANTTIKAIAFLGAQTSAISTAVYTMPVMISDIATLRQQTPGTTIYKLTGEAILTFQQAFRHQKFIQDATAGVMIDDNQAIVTTTYNVGDGISGIIGTLTEFGGVLEFIPVTNPAAATSTGNAIEPIMVTLADFNTAFETYESRVIMFNGVSFNTPQTSFANGTVYPVTDSTTTINFRTTFYDVDYIGTAIPTTPLTLVGIPNSRTDGNYFTSRSLADFVPMGYDVPFDLTYTIQDQNDVALSWCPAPIHLGNRDFRNWEDISALRVYRNLVLIATITDFTWEEYAHYTDANLPNGTYAYYVTNLYSDNHESEPSDLVTLAITGVDDPIIPATITGLTGNFPNPFNPHTSIAFSVKDPTPVKITIYNLKGQKIRTLVDAAKTNGQYKVTWDGRDDNGNAVSGGVYMYKMTAGDFHTVKRMLMLK